MFLRNDLDELLACEAQPAVSIYLPTHKAGREIRQDSIRLRNLLGEAAKRLGAERRPPDVEALLAPARRLVEDEEFWRHQDQGLAIFIAPASSGFTSCRSRWRKRSRSGGTSASGRCCLLSMRPAGSGC